MDQLQRLVLAQPALLTYAPATLASNLAAMALCLGAGRGQVSSKAVHLVLHLAILGLGPRMLVSWNFHGQKTGQCSLGALLHLHQRTGAPPTSNLNPARRCPAWWRAHPGC